MVIAHRLKTVQRADDILILENGCVAEYGPRLRWRVTLLALLSLTADRVRGGAGMTTISQNQPDHHPTWKLSG